MCYVPKFQGKIECATIPFHFYCLLYWSLRECACVLCCVRFFSRFFFLFFVVVAADINAVVAAQLPSVARQTNTQTHIFFLV